MRMVSTTVELMKSLVLSSMASKVMSFQIHFKSAVNIASLRVGESFRDEFKMYALRCVQLQL